MSIVLNSILTATPGSPPTYNVGMAETFSWIPIEGEALGRPLYARANYITNFSDLQIQLSASEVDIGSVHISDQSSGVTADVVAISGYGNGLQVLTQDLQSDIDDITIGDKQGHYADVDPVLSALNVKIVNSNAVSISGNVTVSNTVSVSSTNLPVTITNPVTSVTAIVDTTKGFPVSYALDSGSIDAFGRLRASMPTTLFDSKTLHNKNSLFWSQTATNGSSVYFTSELNDASVTLSATGGTEQYAIRQTTQRFNYQPGKSQLAIFTGILNPVSNAIKRYGLFQSLTAAPFEPNCGLYFETQTDSSSSIAVVQQNDGFLVPSLSARREDWNLDKLDGTGISGKTLRLSAANIFLIDYEWLGVGRVRFGTVIDGQICYCHAFNNAGNVQGAYIKTPNLPVRAEVRLIGAGTASMKMICCSVMSEGGADFTGVTKAVDSGDYPGLTIAAGARRAVLGVRLQPSKLDSVNEVINASCIVIPQGASTQAAYHYELLHNPTLSAGGTWQNVSTDSNFQYWTPPTNPGGVAIGREGTVIASGYGAVGSSIDLANSKFEKFLRMGCSIEGRRDELYLAITPLEANGGVYGAMTFLESD
jgi:hypothetical protein